VSGRRDFSLTLCVEYSAGPDAKDSFLKENIYGLLRGKGKSELLRYYKYISLYERTPDGCLRGKRRFGKREKLSIACVWLADVIQFINPKKSKQAAFQEACDEVQKYAGKYYKNENLEICYEPRVYYKRKKNLLLGPWITRDLKMSENFDGELKYKLARKTYEKIKSLQPYFFEGIDYSRDYDAIEKEAGSLLEEDRLFNRVLRMLRKSQRMTQRELCRKLRVSIAALEPILVIMEFEHIILWNRAEKRIVTDGWNPEDKRKFVWLLDSSLPRFGPKLEKGKVFKFIDFNSSAVKEWIRTRAAKLI